jgi:hypothetical protein
MKNYLAEAVRVLGDVPVGNPDDMRRYARQLRNRADAYHEAAQAIRGAVADGGLIEGGLANRLKAESETLTSDIDGRLAAQVTALADYLEREATNLAHEQAAQKNALQKLADQLLHRDQQAQAQHHGGGGGW